LAVGRLISLTQTPRSLRTRESFYVKPKKLSITYFTIVKLKTIIIVTHGQFKYLVSCEECLQISILLILFRIEGSNCFVGSMHFDANGLYVAVPYYSFSLPSDISGLSNLPEFYHT
jgi:hypothetical protein